MEVIKTRTLAAVILAALFPILSCADAQAQGMCIKSEVTTPVLKGQVWGLYRGNRKLLSQVKIELQQYRNGARRIVATVETDTNGNFDFGKIKFGNYVLVANSYGYVNTEADVNVVKLSKAKEKQGDIIIVLGMALGECGYVEIKK